MNMFQNAAESGLDLAAQNLYLLLISNPPDYFGKQYSTMLDYVEEQLADNEDVLRNLSQYKVQWTHIDTIELEEALSKYGDDYVNRFVAKPGFSEHQTGLSFDIGSTSSNVFANSKEYKWMLDNAYKYGFILRFTKKYESITQFRNEPWHYRYVGKDIAKYIHEHNISFEEYYAMFLDK